MNKNLKAGLITVGVVAYVLAFAWVAKYAPELLGVAILILIPTLIYLIIKTVL